MTDMNKGAKSKTRGTGAPARTGQKPVTRLVAPSAIAIAVAALCILRILFSPDDSHQHSRTQQQRGEAATPEQAFLQWLEQNGCQHSVAIRTPPGGGERGAFAGARILPRGLVARIPMRLAVMFPPDYVAKEQLAILLAREAAGRGGELSRYLHPSILPMLFDRHHTVTYETFPQEYLHLANSQEMVDLINKSQQQTVDLWRQSEEGMAVAGLTFDQLKAAQNTIASRALSVFTEGDKPQLVMVPLMDMANHRSNCTTTLNYGGCSGPGGPGRAPPGGLCLYWRAGPEGFAEGEELCINYAHGSLTPDKAFFEYGFILGDDPPALSRMDMAGFPWEDAEVEEFDGTVSALEKELMRVRERIALLDGAEQEEAATLAAPSDPDGSVLSGLKALRLQRLVALRREAKRLSGRIDFKRRAADAGAAGAGAAAGGGRRAEGTRGGSRDWPEEGAAGSGEL